MTLTPGFYRFEIDYGFIESHAAAIRDFLHASKLLVVRCDSDYAARTLGYVAQYGDDPPEDRLIRPATLLCTTRLHSVTISLEPWDHAR